MREDGKKLTAEDIQSLIRMEADQAESYQASQLRQDRTQALKYYNGEPYGDEIEGRSAIVTTEVRDTIESILPQLVKIFLGTDRVVTFEPNSKEDEAGADQATDYITYILQHDNEAFMLFYTLFKDALLNKNGLVKCYWDETKKTTEETYRCLLEIELKALLNDDEVEPVALEAYEDIISPGQDEMGMPLEPVPTKAFDVTVRRTTKKGKARAVPVPADEFLISARASSIHSARFVAHQPPTTVSDLIEMGFKKEDVWDLVTEEEAQRIEERTQRFAEDGAGLSDSDAVQQALANVKYSEVYMLMDTDGDGIAERWMFKCAGPEYKVLKKERFDAPWPFESVTPVPMPHKFFGRSVFDLVKDIQRVKSTLMRLFLDNLYLTNNNRTAIQDGVVDLDDLLTVRPSGVVRVKGPPAQSIMPLAPQPLGGVLIPAMEYLDTVGENRLGVTKYNQGLDANSLNKTASGISQIMSAAQERLLLIARIFAETGVSGIFRQLLRLTVKYQDKPRTIKLRGRWVPMNPGTWNAEMETSVDVALGTQNAQVMTSMLMQLLGLQQAAMQAQSPLVTWEEIYNTVAKLVEAMGLKNVDSYFKDPGNAPQQQKQPSPEEIKAQASAQEQQMKLQSDQALADKNNQAALQGKVFDLAAKRMDIASREKIEAQKIAAGFVQTMMQPEPVAPQQGGGQAPAKDDPRKPRKVRIVRDPLTREMQFVEEVFEDAMADDQMAGQQVLTQ